MTLVSLSDGNFDSYANTNRGLHEPRSIGSDIDVDDIVDCALTPTIGLVDTYNPSTSNDTADPSQAPSTHGHPNRWSLEISNY